MCRLASGGAQLRALCAAGQGCCWMPIPPAICCLRPGAGPHPPPVCACLVSAMYLEERWQLGQQRHAAGLPLHKAAALRRLAAATNNNSSGSDGSGSRSGTHGSSCPFDDPTTPISKPTSAAHTRSPGALCIRKCLTCLPASQNVRRRAGAGTRVHEHRWVQVWAGRRRVTISG